MQRQTDSSHVYLANGTPLPPTGSLLLLGVWYSDDGLGQIVA